MRNRWRRLSVILPGVCALVLLPIATNIATSSAVPTFLQPWWVSWTGVALFGVVAIIASVRTSHGAAAAPVRDDRGVTGDFRDQDPGPPDAGSGKGNQDATAETNGRAAGPGGRQQHDDPPPVDTMPVRLEALPTRVRGRGDLLGLLKRLRKAGGLVVLTGSGGMGKSTVARELVHRAKEVDRNAWEVSATTLRGLLDGLRAVAANLGASSAEVAAIGAGEPAGADALWRLLEAAAGWVLIVDNADDLSFLGRPARAEGEPPHSVADGTGWIRVARNGLLIVTSRQRNERMWPRSAVIKEVKRLSRRAAAKLLLDLAPGAGGGQAALDLADRLGRLPLAMRLAGLYLGSDFADHDGFTAFRLALESDPTVIRFLELHAGDPEAVERMMVMRTWELSLDALARRGFPQARPLLRLLSCYAPEEPIPLDMLLHGRLDAFFADRADDGATAVRPDQTLQALADVGLIRAGRTSPGSASDRRALILHPVIADTNRVHLIEGSDAVEDHVRRSAVALLAAEMDGLAAERPSTWETFGALAPHVRALISASVNLRDAAPLTMLRTMTGNLAMVYGEQGLPEVGVELLLSVPGLRRDPAPSLAKQQLAQLLEGAGRHRDAVRIWREVYTSQIPLWPRGDPVLLAAWHNVTVSVASKREPADADEAFHALLTEERLILGEDHPITLVTRSRYALTLFEQGRIRESEGALRSLVDNATELTGARSVFTLGLRHNLAQILRLQERAEADEARRQLVQDTSATFGDDHRLTRMVSAAEVSFDIAILFSVPELHENFAPFLLKKGVTMHNEGRVEDAVAVIDDLIARFGGDDSPTISESVCRGMLLRGDWLRDLGRPDRAIDAYDQLVERYAEAASDLLRAIAAQARFNQGVVLANMGRRHDAVAAFDDVITRWGEKPEADVESLIATAYFNKAVILDWDFEEGLRAAQQATARYERLSADDPSKYAEALETLRRLVGRYTADPIEARFRHAADLAGQGRERAEEALAAFDAFITLYRDSPEAAGRIAEAMLQKAILLHNEATADEAA